jgi:hypothetical protein
MEYAMHQILQNRHRPAFAEVARRSVMLRILRTALQQKTKWNDPINQIKSNIDYSKFCSYLKTKKRFGAHKNTLQSKV